MNKSSGNTEAKAKMYKTLLSTSGMRKALSRTISNNDREIVDKTPISKQRVNAVARISIDALAKG